MKRRQKLSYVDDPIAVGRRIRERREEIGLSQRDLAFPGCTAAYISRIEKGERVPSLQILREFALRLGVSEDRLSGVGGGAASPAATARVALRLDRLDDARAIADAALTEARSDLERAQASAVLGEIALATDDARKAIELLERSTQLDPRLLDEDVDVAEALGRAYARASDYESAIAIFRRSSASAARRSDRLAQVRFGGLLANCLADTGDFTGAESALADVLIAGEGLEDPLARAQLLWAQSRLHALQNDSAGAARYAERALEILNVTDQGYQLARAHQLLAHIEVDRGNAERAVELLERASPLVEAGGRPFDRASFRLEQARALLRVGRLDEAAAIAMETAASLAALSPTDSGRSYAVVAGVFAELGDDARAIELYELAIERLREEPTRYLVEAYARLAELYEAHGRKDDALQLLKDAMDVQQGAQRLLRHRDG